MVVEFRFEICIIDAKLETTLKSFLGLGTGSNRVNVLPYQIMAKNDGFHICYPNNVIDVNYVASTFLDNLVFSSASGLGSKIVEDWDELSVTIK